MLIRTHLEQTAADEALVLDSEGFITECCAANLFWRQGKTVFTPSLEQAGVNGIMRQFCLQQLARSCVNFDNVKVRACQLLQTKLTHNTVDSRLFQRRRENRLALPPE